jgi:hypothetical protein
MNAKYSIGNYWVEKAKSNLHTDLATTNLTYVFT